MVAEVEEKYLLILFQEQDDMLDLMASTHQG